MSGGEAFVEPGPVSFALVRRLEASAEMIFAACSDPKWVVRWLAPGAGSARAAMMDVRAGGTFRLEGIDPDGTPHDVCGHHIDIVPDRRIETTWCYRGSASGLAGPPSRVRFDIRPLGPERCKLTLTPAS